MKHRIKSSVAFEGLGGFAHRTDTSYCEQGFILGFAVWIDDREKVVWAQGTHEYRPMGLAVIALLGQFSPRDFKQSLKRPTELDKLFAGFFGSLEEVNHYIGDDRKQRRLRRTPAHLL
jgi:hypothetical protein